MTMDDYLIRATAADDAVRAFAATTRGVAEEARRIHNLSPVATSALGRTLTAAAMMGLTMKNDSDLMTITFDCDGPIGGITVTGDSRGRVKGYVNNPGVMLPPSAEGKLDVGGAVGGGILRVIRDTGLKEPYVGEVSIFTGEIAEDLTAYFAESEQTPSVVGLGVLMNHDNTVREAGGFIIQLMPDTPEEVIAALENNLSRISSVTGLLREGFTPEAILERVLEGLDPVIRDKQKAEYYCQCSRSRVTRSLLAVGRHEIEEMIREGKTVTLSCGFCGAAYDFTVEDLKVLLEAAGQ